MTATVFALHIVASVVGTVLACCAIGITYDLVDRRRRARERRADLRPAFTRNVRRAERAAVDRIPALSADLHDDVRRWQDREHRHRMAMPAMAVDEHTRPTVPQRPVIKTRDP